MMGTVVCSLVFYTFFTFINLQFTFTVFPLTHSLSSRAFHNPEAGGVTLYACRMECNVMSVTSSHLLIGYHKNRVIFGWNWNLHHNNTKHMQFVKTYDRQFGSSLSRYIVSSSPSIKQRNRKDLKVFLLSLHVCLTRWVLPKRKKNKIIMRKNRLGCYNLRKPQDYITARFRLSKSPIQLK